jgi:hypothetical protein
MEISQPHNATGNPPREKPFGIRVSAPSADPFTRLVGKDWHTFHWFATREERDCALQEMGARHRYSRLGDAPSIVLEPIER